MGQPTTLDEVQHVKDVEKSSFRNAMSLFATGVTVITASTDDGPMGMTASAVTSLSLDPVLLLICVSAHLPTHSALESTGRFAVNVLGEGDGELAIHFATPAADKFAGVGHVYRNEVPVLESAIAYFVCDVQERLVGGDHSIFIGAVKQLGLRQEARPLVYFGGRFGQLADSHDELLKSWIEGSVFL
jgi:4-nitrophenol 2-monooxygenase / 4-nitrocatechol 4-monooxygenase, reductase component